MRRPLPNLDGRKCNCQRGRVGEYTIGLWDDRILVTAGLRLQSINVKSYSNATRLLTGE